MTMVKCSVLLLLFATRGGAFVHRSTGEIRRETRLQQDKPAHEILDKVEETTVLDEEKFVLDMDREVEAMEELTKASTQQPVMEVSTLSRAEPLSTQAFERLAKRAQELTEKYAVERDLLKHQRLSSSSHQFDGPTRAFGYLGIAIVAAAFVDMSSLQSLPFDAGVVLAQLNDIQVALLAKASSIDMQPLSELNIDVVQGQVLDRVHQVHDSIALMASNIELPQFKIEEMKGEILARVDEMQDSVTVVASNMEVPQFPDINVEGIKEGMIGRIDELQDSLVAASSNIDIPQFPDVNVEGIKENILDRVSDMQTSFVTIASNIEVPPLPDFNIDGIQENILDRVNEMQASLDVMASNIEVPQLPDLNIDGIQKNILDRVDELQTTVAGAASNTQLQMNVMMQGFLERANELQASVSAMTSSTDLPQFPGLDLDGTKEAFLAQANQIQESIVTQASNIEFPQATSGKGNLVQDSILSLDMQP